MRCSRIEKIWAGTSIDACARGSLECAFAPASRCSLARARLRHAADGFSRFALVVLREAETHVRARFAVVREQARRLEDEAGVRGSCRPHVRIDRWRDA